MLEQILILKYLNINLSECDKEFLDKLDFSYENIIISLDLKYILKEDYETKIKSIKAKVESLKGHNIKYLTLFDKNYPQQLIKEGIYFFLYKGNIDILSRKLVGFVGTRNTTEIAYSNTEFYSQFLSNKGYIVVTGLANGIDTAATKGALKENYGCIEVLPCPIDKITPKGNADLVNQVLNKNGLVISTYFPGTRVYNSNYHERNKIIALLSNSIIVGDTKTTGGTISTMKYSVIHKKQIYLLNYPKVNQNFIDHHQLFQRKYHTKSIDNLKANNN